MDLASVHKLVFDTFKFEFGSRQPGVAMSFENQPFTQPKGQPWVHITLIPGEVKRKEISSAQVIRMCGVVNVQLMVPQDQGTRKLHQMADAVVKIFGDRDFSLPDGRIITYGLEVRNRGLLNGFHCFSVQADYRYETRLNRTA